MLKGEAPDAGIVGIQELRDGQYARAFPFLLAFVGDKWPRRGLDSGGVTGVPDDLKHLLGGTERLNGPPQDAALPQDDRRPEVKPVRVVEGVLGHPRPDRGGLELFSRPSVRIHRSPP